MCVCLSVCLLDFLFCSVAVAETFASRPALNSLDRAAAPWGLAVPAERQKTAQGLPGERVPKLREGSCGLKWVNE